MENQTQNNKRIAKNTLFLYVRMLIIMVVTLYTSRVILQVLGVDNFGLYQAVGGVVGFLAFINGALSTATSRFITFALGKGDKTLFGQIFSFSGWSLFANGAIALSNQGILLLLNLFFAPTVVTARSISLQVNNVANQFVANFRTAANPQIVKRYASGDSEGSKKLLLESTKFSYYLMLLIAVPLFFLADPLLHIWLVEVPDFTVVFLQVVIVQSLFQVFNTSFYTALYAKGRIKENALISPLVVFVSRWYIYCSKVVLPL